MKKKFKVYIITRARACWWEDGEKSTKYFLNLEKRNHVKKHVRKLKISCSIITYPFDILSEQKRFYRFYLPVVNWNKTWNSYRFSTGLVIG